MQTECTLMDGHYQLPLPLRNENIRMPNNRDQAVHRMNWLKRKFAKNEKVYNDYVTFMEEILPNGYARRVPQGSRTPEGQCWYIYPNWVYHPKKPEKIRLVFNCSARYGGTSLNDQLIQGPDLTSSLIGVLTRFRQEPVAFTADIESMFYQVRVPEGQRHWLPFLWWPGGDLTQNLQDYQMNVHLFGAVSSPSCSKFSRKKAAEDSASASWNQQYFEEKFLRGWLFTFGKNGKSSHRANKRRTNKRHVHVKVFTSPNLSATEEWSLIQFPKKNDQKTCVLST